MIKCTMRIEWSIINEFSLQVTFFVRNESQALRRMQIFKMTFFSVHLRCSYVTLINISINSISRANNRAKKLLIDMIQLIIPKEIIDIDLINSCIRTVINVSLFSKLLYIFLRNLVNLRATRDY